MDEGEEEVNIDNEENAVVKSPFLNPELLEAQERVAKAEAEVLRVQALVNKATVPQLKVRFTDQLKKATEALKLEQESLEAIIALK